MKFITLGFLLAFFSQVTFTQPLVGDYTVGSNMGNDFFTLVDAAEALSINGASGSVAFYLEEEVFNHGSVRFENIPGWQDNYMLSIYGTPGDRTKVTISANDSVTLKFENIKNISLTDLTIELSNSAQNLNTACLIKSSSGLDEIRLNNCLVDGKGAYEAMSILSKEYVNTLKINETAVISNNGLSLVIDINTSIHNLIVDDFYTDAYCMFIVNELSDVILNRLRIIDGTVDLRSDKIQNLTIDTSTFTRSFLALYVDTLKTFYFDNSTFTVSDGVYGLGIFCNQVFNTQITNSKFFANSINSGQPAIWIRSSDEVNNLIINNCYIAPDVGIPIVANTITETRISNCILPGIEFHARNRINNIEINSISVSSDIHGILFSGYSSSEINNISLTNSTIRGGYGIRLKDISTVENLQCHFNEFQVPANSGIGIEIDTANTIMGMNISNNSFEGYSGFGVGLLCRYGIHLKSNEISNYNSESNSFKSNYGQDLSFNTARNIQFNNETLRVDSVGIKLVGKHMQDLIIKENYINTEGGRDNSFGAWLNSNYLGKTNISENEFWGSYGLITAYSDTIADTLQISHNKFQLHSSTSDYVGAVSLYNLGFGNGLIKYDSNSLNLNNPNNTAGLFISGNPNSLIRDNYFASNSPSNNCAIDYSNNYYGGIQKIEFLGNNISNFHRGLSVYGATDTLKVTKNEFEDNLKAILLAPLLSQVIIERNSIKSFSSEATHGIILDDDGTSQAHIFNNMILGTNLKALSLYETYSSSIEHNSISVSNTLPIAAIRFIKPTDLTFRNNLIQYHSSNGYIIETDTIYRTKLTNNLYYTNQLLDTFAIYGFKQTQNISLEQWKTLSQTSNSESSLIVGEAPYIDASNDLHISCSAQLPINASQTDLDFDFDNDTFESLSRVGADQITYTKNIIDPISKEFCSGDSVRLTSEIEDAIYRWQIGSKNQSIFAKNEGEFIVKSFKQCNITEQSFNLKKKNLPQTNFTFSTDRLQLFLTNASKFVSNYTWDFGDHTIIYDEENPKHTYGKPGTYNVLLIGENECGKSEFSKDVTIKTPLAMLNSSVNSVQIFPSKVQTKLFIHVPGEGTYRLKIYNLAGTLLMEEIRFFQHTHYQSLDVSQLSKGLHIINLIEIENRNEITAKFTKF